MVVTITRADVERELLRELVAEELGIVGGAARAVPDGWRDWLHALFPSYVQHPFGERHIDFWEWVDAIAPGTSQSALVGVWPRGGAKSTSAEMACCYVGARRTRRYGWYISETQSQADDHVGNVAAMLESEPMQRYYPKMAERSVGKYGNSKGWRRNRLRTADGFTLDALGLDIGARGVKLDEARPDFMVFDDLDRQTDSPDTVERKISILTKSILPAGAAHMVVLAIQNLIHSDGIFARLVGASETAADFLADRIVSGPHPALLDAAYEQRDGRWYIAAGTPTWEGQDRDACQWMIDTFGLSAFKVEAQHEVDTFEGGLFKDVAFRHCQPDAVPDLVHISVWVDPAVSETNKSDSHGIQADGIAADGTIFRLYSWEGITSPLASLRRAIQVALELKAGSVGVETDQGGDTWWSVYREACKSLEEDGTVEAGTKFPTFQSEKAGAGHGPKVERASRQLADYERGLIVHVLDEERSYATLERSLRRFPVRAPHDLVDASYWSWHDLRTRGLVKIGVRPVVRGGMPMPKLAERFAADQERRAKLAAWPVRRAR